MGTIIQLVLIAAVIGGGIIFIEKAWTGFKNSIAAPYVAAQIARDQPQIDAANKKTADADQRALNAQNDTASCKSGAERQNAGVKRWQDEALANLARAKKAETENRQRASERENMRTELQIRAKDSSKAATCEGRLAEIDKMLRDEARARAAAKGKGAPK